MCWVDTFLGKEEEDKKVGRGGRRKGGGGREEKKEEEARGETRDTVEDKKEKAVMGEVVRVFPANLLFHLCSPPALQPRPAKRHFTSHPHTHGARASTQKHTHTHTLSKRGHPQICTVSPSLTHTVTQLAFGYLATYSEK